MYEIIRLINQIPEIKKAFYLSENVGSFQCKLIYDTEVFLLWKENMKYELGKVNQTTFITEFIQLLDSVNGWHDESDFSVIEVKAATLKKNLSDFFDTNNENQIIDCIISILLDIAGENNDIYLANNDSRLSFLPNYEKYLKKLNMLRYFSKFNSDVTGGYMIELSEKALTYFSSEVATVAIEEKQNMNNKIFIVHGHDETAKINVARTLENLGFEAIILHEQADGGRTIIEKIEYYTDVSFAVVLYTECDIGGAKGQSNQKPRARQNVVFEHGYLIGKLGRNKVCAIVKGNVETPGDISGVVYTPMDELGAWKMQLAKNMREAGLEVDMNKL